MIKSNVPNCTKTWLFTNSLPMFFDVLPKKDQDLYLTIQMFKESVYYLCDLFGVVNEDMTIDEVCDKLYEQEECRLREKIEQIKFYN